MELSWNMFSFKVRHAVLFFVCLFAIYLCRVREQYTMQPTWRRDFDARAYSNGRHPTLKGKLPAPRLTDLDGDGKNELILITPDLKLQVLYLPQGATDSSVLPHVKVLHTTPIPLTTENTGIDAESSTTATHGKDASMIRSWPAVMETGYLDQYNETVNREQVIVIVLDDWSVLCFDATLTLLWTQQPMTINNYKDFYVKSMSALITPLSVARATHGAVIVGASFHHKAHHKLKMERLEQYPGVGSGLDPARVHGEYRRSNRIKEENYTHFSSFALNGRDGAVLWHHQPKDFEREKPKQFDHPHHWKLSLQKHSSHIGESHWSQYSNAILGQLPHSWLDVTDTKIDLHSIRPNGYNEDTQTQSVVQEIFGLDHTHIVGLAYGGMRPHAAHEHVRSPNALVIHHNTGVQILTLSTGQPMTELSLKDEGTVYADLDADGTIEQLKTDYADDFCGYLVSSLQPTVQLLYTNPLCTAPTWWSILTSSATQQTPHDAYVSVRPILVKRIAQHTGPFSHLMGHTLASRRKGYDSVFLTSSGRLTSYSPLGHFNWQTETSAQWSEQVTQDQLNINYDYRSLLYDGFTPSLTVFSAQIYGEQTMSLSLGWDYVTLSDLRDGSTLSHHTLPCPPIHPPVVGDYNGDGFTDLIHVCPSGLIGFTLDSHPNYVRLVATSVTVVSTILLLTWCCQPNKEERIE